MRRVGFQNFRVFPLEYIPLEAYKAAGAVQQAESFRQIANPREKYWIERLHSYTPSGYNVQDALRRRHRPKRAHKPMLWSRRGRGEVALSPDSLNGQCAAGDSPSHSSCGDREENVSVYPRVYGYRDYLRRCRFLARQHELSRLDDVHWDWYSSKVLVKMSDLLRSGDHDIAADAAAAIIDRIRDHFLLRWRPKRSEKVVPNVVRIEWHSRLLRCVPLQHVMSKPEHVALLPDKLRECVEGLVVAKKLVEPISRQIFNYPNVARSMGRGQPARKRQPEPAHGSDTEGASSSFTDIARMLVDGEIESSGSVSAAADLGGEPPFTFAPQTVHLPEVESQQRSDDASAGLQDVPASDKESEVFDFATADLGGEPPRTSSPGVTSTADDDLSDSCPCRRLFASRFRPHDGCVLTGDLSIVRQRALRTLLAYGSRFRTHVSVDPMTKLGEALADFVNWQSASHEVEVDAFDEWLAAVKLDCQRRLAAFRQYRTKSPVVLTDEVRKYLRFLQHHLVLVPVDKAANNISFICKRLYVATLSAELYSPSGAYAPVTDMTAEEILSHHADVLGRSKLTGDPKLPYLYWLPKLHKDPVGHRFIAASARCSTTELSKVLSDALNFVLQTLRDKDDRNVRASGVRRYFVVQGYEEVAFFLSRWRRRTVRRALYSGDFSTMYTSIPHDDLLARVREALWEAWDFVGGEHGRDADEILLEWKSGGNVSWVMPRSTASYHSGDTHRWTLEGLLGAVRFLVRNVYLVNGAQCWRQVIGIPMGTNCAPPLANLYLYAYESRFVDGLVTTRPKVARNFHMSFRLIDDLLAVDNPYLRDAIASPAEEGGLYPRALRLNETSISDEEVRFLGMTIRSDGESFRVDVFDKRTEFPFRVIRYPHTDSLIPPNIPYGVFIGQLHRYYRICSDATDFLRNSLVLASTLRLQGCAAHKLAKCFHAFVSSRPRLRWKRTAADLHRRFTAGLGRS
jgi:hypothetical protein